MVRCTVPILVGLVEEAVQRKLPFLVLFAAPDPTPTNGIRARARLRFVSDGRARRPSAPMFYGRRPLAGPSEKMNPVLFEFEPIGPLPANRLDSFRKRHGNHFGETRPGGRELGQAPATRAQVQIDDKSMAQGL